MCRIWIGDWLIVSTSAWEWKNKLLASVLRDGFSGAWNRNMCFWSRAIFRFYKLQLRKCVKPHAFIQVYRPRVGQERKKSLKTSDIKTWTLAMWVKKDIKCSENERKLELIWPTFGNDDSLGSCWVSFPHGDFFLMACEPSCELLSNERVSSYVFLLRSYKTNINKIMHHHTPMRLRFEKSVYKIPQSSSFLPIRFAAFWIKGNKFHEFSEISSLAARHSRLHHTTKIFSELNNAVSLLYDFWNESVCPTSVNLISFLITEFWAVKFGLSQ